MEDKFTDTLQAAQDAADTMPTGTIETAFGTLQTGFDTIQPGADTPQSAFFAGGTGGTDIDAPQPFALRMASANPQTAAGTLQMGTDTLPPPEEMLREYDTALYQAADGQIFKVNLETRAGIVKTRQGPDVQSVLDGIAIAMEEEAEIRAESDALLQENIDAEAQARENADAALQDALDAEESARIESDDALREDLATEIQARKDADGNLRSELQAEFSDAIDAEEAARQAADAALQDALDAEESARIESDDALREDLATEIQARKDADGNLRSELQAEFSDAMDAEEAARQAADAALQGSLNAEAQARTDADTALQGNINAEAQLREAADTALQGSLNEESAARQNADTLLGSRIDDEANLRSGADTTLQNEIASEASLRANADTAINNALALKAPLASPAFTGVPTAPTASMNSNGTQIANTAFVQSLYSRLVDGAPDLLNTMGEFSKAINNDPNFAATVATQIGVAAGDAANALALIQAETGNREAANEELKAWAEGKITETAAAHDVLDGRIENEATARQTADNALQTAINGKADAGHSHSDLAPKASPALTGTPTAPTASAGTNNTQIATTAFVSTAVTNATANLPVSGHTHAATDITSGILPIAQGGTGRSVMHGSNGAIRREMFNTIYNLSSPPVVLMGATDSYNTCGYITTANAKSLLGVTDLQTAVNGKANSSHSHAQADISGLTDALAGKAASSHSHTDLAPKASPALTGTPTAPTASAGTNNTQIATTAFVQSAVGNAAANNAATATKVSANIGSGTADLVVAELGSNDGFRIRAGSDSSDNSWVEIATGDNSEPIYVRQYSSNTISDHYVTLAREAVLLDRSGNTKFPGTVTAQNFVKADGTALGGSGGSTDLSTATGVLPIARGGTGATAVTGNSGAVHALFPNGITSDPGHWAVLTANYANTGYITTANAKTVLTGDCVKTSGNQTIAGTKTFSSNIAGNITGNAATATKLQTARTITLAGDVTGSASFDGSGNITINVSVVGGTGGSGGATASDSHGVCFSSREWRSDGYGFEWYRFYSDGWLEQGGAVRTPSGSGAKDLQVPLHFPYSNTGYSIAMGLHCNNHWQDRRCTITGHKDKTANGYTATIHKYNTSTSNGIVWRTCGQAGVPIPAGLVSSTLVSSAINDGVWCRLWSDGWLVAGGTNYWEATIPREGVGYTTYDIPFPYKNSLCEKYLVSLHAINGADISTLVLCGIGITGGATPSQVQTYYKEASYSVSPGLVQAYHTWETAGEVDDTVVSLPKAGSA